MSGGVPCRDNFLDASEPFQDSFIPSWLLKSSQCSFILCGEIVTGILLRVIMKNLLCNPTLEFLTFELIGRARETALVRTVC